MFKVQWQPAPSSLFIFVLAVGPHRIGYCTCTCICGVQVSSEYKWCLGEGGAGDLTHQPGPSSSHPNPTASKPNNRKLSFHDQGNFPFFED
jgi:hypothetical protein